MIQGIEVADWSDADGVFKCYAAGAPPLTVENTF
jgi:hypothetical protein